MNRGERILLLPFTAVKWVYVVEWASSNYDLNQVHCDDKTTAERVAKWVTDNRVGYEECEDSDPDVPGIEIKKQLLYRCE